MPIDNLPLLRMLVMEYNQLVNSSVIPSAPPDDDDANSDFSNLCSTVDDEADMEVEELEI